MAPPADPAVSDRGDDHVLRLTTLEHAGGQSLGAVLNPRDQPVRQLDQHALAPSDRLGAVADQPPQLTDLLRRQPDPGQVVEGLTAPLVIDGAVNGELFLAYSRQAPVPTLKPGDIVVMDNLSSHKRVAGREPSKPSGRSAANSLIASLKTNAETTSAILGIARIKMNSL